MAYFHDNLTQEKWDAYGRTKQILNIASELSRAKNCHLVGDRENLFHSLDRTLELIDMTVCSWRNFHGLREILRFRELVAGIYITDNIEKNYFLDLIAVLLCLDKDSSLVGNYDV